MRPGGKNAVSVIATALGWKVRYGRLGGRWRQFVLNLTQNSHVRNLLATHLPLLCTCMNWLGSDLRKEI